MGAAQVPTNVGMPPKDGTPCHAGACRGGFGRANPGQPRCDRPGTSVILRHGEDDPPQPDEDEPEAKEGHRTPRREQNGSKQPPSSIRYPFCVTHLDLLCVFCRGDNQAPPARIYCHHIPTWQISSRTTCPVHGRHSFRVDLKTYNPRPKSAGLR